MDCEGPATPSGLALKTQFPDSFEPLEAQEVGQVDGYLGRF